MNLKCILLNERSLSDKSAIMYGTNSWHFGKVKNIESMANLSGFQGFRGKSKISGAQDILEQ